jgi:hypothetical protein
MITRSVARGHVETSLVRRPQRVVFLKVGSNGSKLGSAATPGGDGLSDVVVGENVADSAGELGDDRLIISDPNARSPVLTACYHLPAIRRPRHTPNSINMALHEGNCISTGSIPDTCCPINATSEYIPAIGTPGYCPYLVRMAFQNSDSSSISYIPNTCCSISATRPARVRDRRRSR